MYWPVDAAGANDRFVLAHPDHGFTVMGNASLQAEISATTLYEVALSMSLDLGQSSSGDRPLKRPRPRPVISCLRCREKKLKCDRVTPCENCSKAGCASTCEYQDGQGQGHEKRARPETRPHTVPLIEGATPSGTGVGVIEDLQRRLKRVEELLAIRSESIASTGLAAGSNGIIEGTRQEQVAPSRDLNSSPTAGVTMEAAVLAPEAATRVASSTDTHHYPGTLVVKGTRTRYHGPTSRITLLNEFEGAKETVGECNDDNSISRLAKEVQFLQTKARVPARSPSISNISTTTEFASLRQCIPERDVCDRLVGLYIFNHEQTFRVLHIPTFRRQYNEFWTMNQNSDWAAAFVSQLIPVLAAAVPFADYQFRYANRETCEHLQRPAIDLVRTYLERLSRKQRIELSTLQTETLILIARCSWSESPEELWRASGSLLRSGMVMGLHIDPSTCSDISIFQAEMRRRLWSTIVELDLQASIASGMPVGIPYLDPHSLASANIVDEQFDETSTELPLAKPLTECTDGLAQVTLASSLIARVHAMNVPSDNMTAIEQLSRQLEDNMQKVPYCLKVSPNLACTNLRRSILGRVLLDLCLQRPLLYLCRTAFIQSNNDHDHFLAIRERLVDSSSTILSYQKLFDPFVTKSMTQQPPEICELFYSLMKSDVLQAALNICKYLMITPISTSTQIRRRQLEREVESTIQTLIRNLDRPGSDMKEIVLLTVALHSTMIDGPPHEKREQMKTAIQDALSECRHHLTSSAKNLGLQDQDLWDPSTSLTDVQGLWGDDVALAADFSNFMADHFWPSDGDADGEFFRLFVDS